MQGTGARIAGVGMTAFTTPRRSAPYTRMAVEAGQAALADAGLSYADIQQVYPGYVYGDSTSGQHGLRLGLSGVPVVNVNNNCSTGSTALFRARQETYFPSNGSLLLAVGMMAAGWEGSEGPAPGFPREGWGVRRQGLRPLP